MKGQVALHHRPAYAAAQKFLTDHPTATRDQVEAHLKGLADDQPEVEIPAPRTLGDWVEQLRPTGEFVPWRVDLADPVSARAVLPVLAWLAEEGQPLRQGVGDWMAWLVAVYPDLAAPDHWRDLYNLSASLDQFDEAEDLAALSVLIAMEPWKDHAARFARAVAAGLIGGRTVLSVLWMTFPRAAWRLQRPEGFEGDIELSDTGLVQGGSGWPGRKRRNNP